MTVRPGDRVVCAKCNRREPCVGTILGIETWYGKKIVNVHFNNPKWFECEHDVVYLADLEPMPRKNGVRYYSISEKPA